MQQTIRQKNQLTRTDKPGFEQEPDPNKPYPYFSSGAYKRDGIDYDHKKHREYANADYKTYIRVATPLAIFMIYFCILRDENEMDEKLGADFYLQFGKKAVELKSQYQYALKHGLPVADIIAQMDDAGIPKWLQPPQYSLQNPKDVAE